MTPYRGPTLGWEALRWITRNLVVPDGEKRGEKLVLTDEQAELILRFYAVNPDGSRKYRRALISRPKGWGKSPLLAALCAFEAVGPCRFAGWKPDGQPKGKPVATPLVQMAAVSEDQTDNTYSLLYQMLTEGPVMDRYSLDVGLTRIFIPGGGKIEPVTASAGAREGQRVTFACLDETHLWLPSNRGVALAATIRRNAAKMKGATFETTNAYRPGQESVAEASASAAKTNSEGLLYDHVEPSRSPSLDNKAETLKALRNLYRHCPWVDVDRLYAEIQDPATDPSDARRFYLNQIVHAADAAFDLEQWNGCADPSVVVPDGELVVLGFDGARFHDTTALVGTTVEMGHQFVLGTWERPQDAPDDWEVDEDDVKAVVEQAFDRYDVWRLYADPPYWEDTVNHWAGRWPERVVSWRTNRNAQMAYALRGYSSAMRAGSLTHDGDSVMAQHIGHARKRETKIRDAEGRMMWLIQKEHPNSPNKIDAAMAGCLSWEARGDAIADGATKRKKYRVASF